MPLKIEFNHPQMEKGTEFDLGGFLVPNGGFVELTEDQEISFLARHRMEVKEALSGVMFVKVSGKAEASKAMVDSYTTTVRVEAPTTEEVEGSEN
jgi:hypothetical protein